MAAAQVDALLASGSFDAVASALDASALDVAGLDAPSAGADALDADFGADFGLDGGLTSLFEIESHIICFRYKTYI